MKKGEHHRNVSVFLGGSHNVQVMMLDEHEIYSVCMNDRGDVALLLLVHEHRHELFNDGEVDVAAIIATYQNLSL